MHPAVTELMTFVDDAMNLAKEAVDQASVPAPALKVELRKVASDATYGQVAKAVASTGVLRKSASQIETILRQSDENQLLQLMEKLASTAVFPVTRLTDDDVTLVKKAGDQPSRLTEVPADDPNRKTKLWAAARAEYEAGR